MSAPTSRDVAVVVVTHQTRDELLGCLESLDKTGVEQVVVVDCESTDGSVEAVRDQRPDVKVMALTNVGFGRAANAGVARTDKPYVVVANADTRFDPESIQAMVTAAGMSEDIGAIGPEVQFPDGRPQSSARTFPTLGQAAGHALLGLWWPKNRWTRTYRQLDVDNTEAREVDWLSGCALLLRRTAFDEVGGFDPGYWMYVEDVDLGYRLREAGWRIRYEPAAQVTHRVGASTSKKRRTKMVVAHAKSLDRFYGRAYNQGVGRLARPFVRMGLVLWIALVLVWDRVVARRTGRPSTGE